MEIVNFLRQPAQIESVHGGEGLCRNCRVLGPESFDTPVRFLYYTVLPSGASFGEHTHGDDNEVYLVLEGSGLYSMNGEYNYHEPVIPHVDIFQANLSSTL